MVIRMENLWGFAQCENCTKYQQSKDEDGLICKNLFEKFLSCIHQENCIDARRKKLAKEREERLQKMFFEHPYHNYRATVIEEIKKHLNIFEVKENISSYNYESCCYILNMPCNFHFAIPFTLLDDYHTINNFSAQKSAHVLVDIIRRSFLDNTINRKVKE